MCEGAKASSSSGESSDEDYDSSNASALDMSSLVRSRSQQAAPVKLAGMIVPVSEQLYVGVRLRPPPPPTNWQKLA